MRAFVAIGMSPEVRAGIAAAIEPLRASGAAVRWLRPESIHLTLQFLGYVSDDRIPEICAALADAITPLPPFAMHLEGLGAFPDMRRARVWWIGVRPSRSLETVHFAVEGALARLGFEPEARTFHPHLTVARAMREARRVDAAAVATAAASFGYQAPMEVETVDLMRSDLRRSGAIYTAVQRFPMIPR